jgi:hypothetical protein
MPYSDDEYEENKNNNFDVDFNEYDKNDNPLICREDLIILTLNERQDATFHMFNLLNSIIQEDNIEFMRFMNYTNFNNWFIHHFDSDLVD